MVKFIKDLQRKTNDFVRARREASRAVAMGQGIESLKTIYKIYFWSMDKFLEGKPTYWQRMAWKQFVIPAIDEKYNLIAKQRAELVLDKVDAVGEIETIDKDWINDELYPYFEQSLKRQTGKIVSELDIEEIDDSVFEEKMQALKKTNKGRFK